MPAAAALAAKGIVGGFGPGIGQGGRAAAVFHVVEGGIAGYDLVAGASKRGGIGQQIGAIAGAVTGQSRFVLAAVALEEKGVNPHGGINGVTGSVERDLHGRAGGELEGVGGGGAAGHGQGLAIQGQGRVVNNHTGSRP